MPEVLLLVNAIRLVSRKEFSEESIDIAYLLATDFILTTEKIYGIEHNSYNMHIFLHAIEFARKWGGLWATSAFMYESEIASIKRYYHGSKAPEKLIFGYALMRNKIRNLPARTFRSLPNKCKTSTENWTVLFFPAMTYQILQKLWVRVL